MSNLASNVATPGRASRAVRCSAQQGKPAAANAVSRRSAGVALVASLVASPAAFAGASLRPAGVAPAVLAGGNRPPGSS